MRDDIVQLPRDPLSLLGHGGTRPLVLIALDSTVRSVSECSLWRRSRIVTPASHGPPKISAPKTMSPQ